MNEYDDATSNEEANRPTSTPPAGGPAVPPGFPAPPSWAPPAPPAADPRGHWPGSWAQQPGPYGYGQPGGYEQPGGAQPGGPSYPTDPRYGPDQGSGWGGGWPPSGGGAGGPGGWPPAGGGWQPPGGPGGGRPPRRGGVGRAVAGIAAAGLIAAGIGVVIGHLAWSSPSGSASATGPSATAPSISPSTGNGSGTSPSTGNGSGSSGGSGSGGFTFPGSGGSGSGSGGSGSGSGGSGSGSGGSGSGSSPYPFGNPYGGGSGSGGGSSDTGHSVTNASGGPSNLKALRNKVEPGIVDIASNVTYQDEEAFGTGMVLTPNGEILTNNHVILDSNGLRVTDLGNGKTYNAKVVGYDDSQDVAVIQLEGASGLKTVNLGNSNDVKAGEAIAGIGNAGGAGGTPSVAGGSVSALDQSITASDQGGGHAERLKGLIETNAHIQEGDSGGPLVTTSGQVVGMDTAADSSETQTQAASSATQAYSIPIDEALSIAKQIESGKSSHLIHVGPTAFLGVEVESPSAAGQIGGSGSTGGSSSSSGAEIVEVIPQGSAANAGLQAGDIITRMDGHNVPSPDSLTNIMLSVKAGQSVPVTYTTSSGQTHTVTVHLLAGPPQ